MTHNQAILDQYAAGERYFQKLDLRDADLHNAKLTGVILHQVNLTRVNLAGAELTKNLGFKPRRFRATFDL